MSHRFGDALEVTLPPEETVNGALIPPISVQVLLENAVKHNAFSDRDPLRISVSIGPDHVEVYNERRPRLDVRPSSGIGLKNLSERFELLTRRPIEVVDQADEFRVSLPIVNSAAS